MVLNAGVGEIDESSVVWKDTVKTNKSKIPRVYIAAHNGALNDNIDHLRFLYETEGEKTNLIWKEETDQSKFVQSHGTLNGIPVLVVYCQIPQDCTLVHDPEYTDKEFQDNRQFSHFYYERRITSLRQYLTDLTNNIIHEINSFTRGRSTAGVPYKFELDENGKLIPLPTPTPAAAA